MRALRGKAPGRQAGLTYAESLAAMLVLGVCLAPVLQTISDHAVRQSAVPTGDRDLTCLVAALERTVAAPYEALQEAATSTHANGVFSSPSATYSRDPTPACPERRDVYILKYDPKASNPFDTVDGDMLYVRIEQAGGLKTATLVVRQ